MRVAIVNDTPTAAEHLRRILTRYSNHSLAWIAANGAEAVERCVQDRPDLILMDLLMPVMDGIDATRRIMQRSPCAILVVTAYMDSQVGKVFEALGAGALDAVLMPSTHIDEIERLLQKLNTIKKLVAPHQGGKGSVHAAPTQLVAIGASTGGPKILANILRNLPVELPAAVVIVQHIDKQFALELVAWLRTQTRLPVSAAQKGDRLRSGQVLLAASNQHLVLTGDGTLGYTQEPADYPYRPSVDVFFDSLRRHWKAPGIAALLTGMGSDGAKGLLNLYRAGWHTIAQERTSCAVYGMPKVAVELGAAREILIPEQIAATIVKLIEKPSLGRLST